MNNDALYSVSMCLGMLCYRWDFASWDAAVNAVESLSEFAQNPNVYMLQARAIYDETIEAIVYRDNRRPHKINR